MHFIDLIVISLLEFALVDSRKNKKCKMNEGLACYSYKPLEPGLEYTIASKSCKKGKYPKNEHCQWAFYFKGCIPKVHCDYIDIKGKGKRCRGDKLRMTTRGWGQNLCGKKTDVAVSPEVGEPYEGSGYYYNDEEYLDIFFSTNRRKQGRGFKCQVYCKESEIINKNTTTSRPTPTGETPVPITTTLVPITTTTPVPITTTTLNPAPPSGECRCGIANRAIRTVRGEETEVNEYPWQVMILLDTVPGRPWCGGSILSNRTILTAARCTKRIAASRLTVVVSEHDWTDPNDGQINFSVCSKTEHPSYDLFTGEFDFAVLTVCSDISFNKFASPVCLPPLPTNDYANVPAIVSGWGSLSFQGSQSKQLMEVTVQTITNTACYNAYGYITEQTICTTKPGKDACQGDAGGPLVTAEPGGYYSLIGVVSFDTVCVDPDYPELFRRVTAVRDFIQENTVGSTCPPP